MSCLMRSNCSSAGRRIELPTPTIKGEAFAVPGAILRMTDSLRP